MSPLVAWSMASAETPRTLTLAQQETDLAVLRQTLQEYHPGLTLYATREELDAAFAAARAGFTEGASGLAFLADVLPILEAVGCTHTQLRLSPELADSVGDRFFPLDLVVVGGRSYIDPRVHEGPAREVVSVEDLPADELLTALRARIPSDGRALPRKDAFVDSSAPIWITALLGERDVWTVTTREVATGEVVTTEHAGVRRSRLPARRPDRRRPFVDDEGGHRTLVVPLQFAEGERSSRSAVRRLRRKAERVDAVVLDLRGNGGGRTQSLLDLWALFAERPLQPYVLGWTRRADEGWPSAPTDELPPGTPDDVFRAAPEDLYPAVEPNPRRLDLPVVVVTDGTTGSSASDLAYFFQSEGRATVVGTETASGRWLQNCERYKRMFLRESWLLVTVPLVSLATADVEGRGHGVVPDVEVAPTLDDLASGRDVVLERALEEARARSGP